jgi:hypothetical protein
LAAQVTSWIVSQSLTALPMALTILLIGLAAMIGFVWLIRKTND